MGIFGARRKGNERVIVFEDRSDLITISSSRR
jgi:hypothetical protein